MKNKRLKTIAIVGICTVLLVGFLIFAVLRHKAENQAVTILKKYNVEEYEAAFHQDLSSYVNAEDAGLSVKDITNSDLNNGYLNDKLVEKHYYTYSGMAPLQKDGKVPYGSAYRIPTIYLAGGSNVLFSNTDGNNWTVGKNSIQIAYTFDIITKPEAAEAVVDIGLWLDGNFIGSSNNQHRHYEEALWAYNEGESFCPRIRNEGTEDFIITNGRITIIEDEAVKLYDSGR